MCVLCVLQEKKQMVTYNRELLMAFVYFDQSHCGYLLERDLEEILYTLGLHLSRAQVNAWAWSFDMFEFIVFDSNSYM